MYELILIPIAVGVITQAFKLMTDGIPGNFTPKNLIKDYGGMPSSHSAFVVALATVIGLKYGLNSAAFALSLALAIIVIRDAMGFRREIGRNAVFTNILAQEIFKNKSSKFKNKIEYLNEQMGHSFLEVLAGSIIGCAGATLLFYWLAIYF